MRSQRHTPTRSMNTIKVGSLFSGYGGLDLAVHMAIPDTRTVWVSDVEPGPNKILAERFPDAPNLGDITTIDWGQVEPVDILVGGSPCQDLSAAGQRAGMKPGTRSGLWESMAKAIKVLHPSLVVWENVKGALSADAFSLSNLEPGTGPMGDEPGGPFLRALGRVLGDLTNLGYDAQWATIRAADVGAPHNRGRVFLAAHPSGDKLENWEWCFAAGTEHSTADSRHPLLPAPTSSEGSGAGQHGDSGLDLRTTVQLLPTPKAGDADFGLPRTSGRPPEKSMRLATRIAYGLNKGEYRADLPDEGSPHPILPGLRDAHEAEEVQRKARRLFAVHIATDMFSDLRQQPEPSPGEYSSMASTQDQTPSGLRRVRDNLQPACASQRQGCDKQQPEQPSNTMCELPPLPPLGGGSRRENEVDFGPYSAAIQRWEQVLGRKAPLPTEPSRSGKPQLSPRFVEFLMGLPAGWVTDIDISRAQQLRALGNGVVPQQGAAAITHLLTRK